MGITIGPSKTETPGGGITGLIVWSPFTATSAVTVGNTGVETSLIGAGVGTTTIPASYLSIGSMIRVSITGTIGTDVVVPAITIKFYYGATVIATATHTPVAQLAAASFFEFTATSVVTAIGASGSMTAGAIMWPRTLTALGPFANPAAVSVDTTTAKAIDVKVTWGTANANNTITAGTAYIEMIG